jgi:hypothetical protein
MASAARSSPACQRLISTLMSDIPATLIGFDNQNR